MHEDEALQVRREQLERERERSSSSSSEHNTSLLLKSLRNSVRVQCGWLGIVWAA